MLNDATCFKKIFIVTGYTNLRSGIDRLADTIRSYLGEDAIEADTLYLFCGRRTDRIKGLVWENDGYLLLYKRLEAGQFQWPRTESEVRSITEQQFRWLMEGLTTHPKKQVKRLKKAPDYTLYLLCITLKFQSAFQVGKVHFLFCFSLYSGSQDCSIQRNKRCFSKKRGIPFLVADMAPVNENLIVILTKRRIRKIRQKCCLLL